MGSAFSACLGAEEEINPKYKRVNKNLIGNPTNFEHRSHFGNENLSNNDYKADMAKIKMATLSKSFDPTLLDNPTSVIQNAIPIEQAQAQLFSRLEEFKRDTMKNYQVQESTVSPSNQQPAPIAPPVLPPLESQNPLTEFGPVEADLSATGINPNSIENSEFFKQPLNQSDNHQKNETEEAANETLLPLEAEQYDTALFNNPEAQSTDVFDTVLSDISPNSADENSQENSKPLPSPPKN